MFAFSFRQDLIDQFNTDNDIFIFLLSTKAGWENKIAISLLLMATNGVLQNKFLQDFKTLFGPI